MNDYLLISKRATQIIQDNEQEINYLNINAAINQAAREFKERENDGDTIERTIKQIIQ